MLVDDVHRADEDELRRLRRVLAGMEPGSAAAVAYRRGTPRPRDAVGRHRHDVPRFRLTVLRDRLAPWDEERVRRAAAEVLGRERELYGRGRERAARAYRRVPRAVVDLLAMLREQRPAFTGTAAEVAAAGVPTRLAELVLSRTYALSPAHRPLVWAAGVMTGPPPATS